MIQKRRALLAALIAGGSTVPAGAGCFDWLFHKHHTPVQPYAVGLAPATTITPLGPPVPIGPPTITAHGPAASPADLTPVAVPTLGAGAHAANYGALRPTAAAQMAPYALLPQPINNPSVLTGMPVVPGAPSLPGGAFRAPTSPLATAYYGGATVPATSYNAAAAFQSQPGAAVIGQPLLAPPAAAQPQGHHGGGWLSRMFGTSYQTNYNDVPTTVFRPVQQVDPATGQTVVVQQPCTTTIQQVQRTPYASLQPAQPAVATPYYGEPTCGNEPPQYLQPQQYAPQQSLPQQYAPQQYAPQQSLPQQYAPQQALPQQYAPQSQIHPQAGLQSGSYAPIGSGVAQATATAPAYGAAQQFASPIPSTPPPTTAPLQGYPSGSVQPSDQMRIEQPRLQSWQSSIVPVAPSQTPAASAWQDAGSSNQGAYRSTEPTAAWNQSPFRQETHLSQGSTPALPALPSAGTTGSHYSSLPPIPAADNYRPPAWQTQSGGNGVAEPTNGRLPAPPTESQWQQRPMTPPSLNDRTVSQPIQGVEQSARYASTLREPQRHVAKPIGEAPRDDSGWVAISP